MGPDHLFHRLISPLVLAILAGLWFCSPLLRPQPDLFLYLMRLGKGKNDSPTVLLSGMTSDRQHLFVGINYCIFTHG